MAKKRKKVRNKTKVKPVNYLDKLNRLKELSFESDVVPEFVGVTKPNEFTRFDGSIVPSGITYHIEYDGEAKTELYLTGERFTDESIGLVRIKGESSFGQYKRLRGKLVNQQYFEPYVFEPKKKDFKRGFSYRFFARKRFGNKDVFEISETDFKKESVMYDVVETRWFVGDNKYEIQIQNPILVEELVEKGFIELEDLNIMEGFTGKEDELLPLRKLGDLLNRSRRKKRSRGKTKKRGRRGSQKGQSQSSSTRTSTQAPPSGGGGGGAY